MINNFEFIKTDIKGLIIIKPFNALDERGNFIKDYSSQVFSDNGIKHEIKEIFYSKSVKGVIRGLHFQREKQQAKQIRCVTGRIFDVVIDLRKDSPTFKKCLTFDLSEDNKMQILVPHGCAHGFLALENSIVSYKCDEFFYSQYDDGIKWDDKDLNVSWPLELLDNDTNIIISDKDANLQSFKDFMNTYGGF